MKHILSQCRVDRNIFAPVSGWGVGSGLNFGRVLVPLKLARSSAAALATASRLARESGGKIVLLHAIQLNIVGEERGIARARLLNDLKQEAELSLWQLADLLGGSTTPQVIVEEGRPAEVILDAALKFKADVIVMSTHGRSRWLRCFHQNTASRVARLAECSVWLVAPDRYDEGSSCTAFNRAARTPHDRSSLPNENRSAAPSLV